MAEDKGTQEVQEVTLEQLGTMMTEAAQKAVRDVFEEAQGELKHDEKRREEAGTEDDPLATEATEKRIDELVTKGIAAALKQHEDDVARRAAEEHAARVDAASGSDYLAKAWPLTGRELQRKATKADESLRAAWAVSDDLLIIAKHAINPLAAAKRYLDFNEIEAPAVTKALDTYTSSEGVDWIPTLMSSSFVEDVHEATTVVPVFPSFAMAGQIVKLPRATGEPVVYRMTGAENSNVTESTTPQSGAVTWTAEDFKVYRAYSDNIDEDSIVSVLPMLRASLAKGLARWLDLAVLNGDTAGTHHDSDITATTDPRKAWIGLREKALTDTGANADLSTFNLDTLLAIPSEMGKYAEDSKSLAMIVPTKINWTKLMTLKDSSGNAAFMPVTGAGGAASPVGTGEVGRLGGIPVVVSGLIRTDLNSTGVYAASSTNTVLYVVYRDAWALGTRREITMETDKDIVAGTNKLVLTWRGDFQHLYDTDLTTAMAVNI